VLPGVVGQQRRYLQGNPTIDTVGPFVDGFEQIGGPYEIRERQVEEQIFLRLALLDLSLYSPVVCGAIFDSMIKDGGIRRESGAHRV
jgi:hypothetical protein